MSSTLKEAPQLHQRANGYIEGALRLFTVTKTLLQNSEELGCNGYAAVRRLAIDNGELAIWFVMAHQVVQPIDFLESSPDSSSKKLRARPVSDDRENGPHRVVRSLVASRSTRICASGFRMLAVSRCSPFRIFHDQNCPIGYASPLSQMNRTRGWTGVTRTLRP